MRVIAGILIAGAVSAGAGAIMWMRTPVRPPVESIPRAVAMPLPSTKPAPGPDLKSDLTADITASIPEKKPVLSALKPACSNPNALGIARTVEIDTTGGPGFGFEHFKQLDFLEDKEVVLTFDDGPWPNNTPAVLKALADECTKGLFFAIGKHATYHPEILKAVANAGHTVGAHT